jgi:hypothetical protein
VAATTPRGQTESAQPTTELMNSKTGIDKTESATAGLTERVPTEQVITEEGPTTDIIEEESSEVVFK